MADRHDGPRRAGTSRHRVLVGALVVTGLVVLAGLLGLPGTDLLRRGGALALGPVERLAGSGQDERLARLQAERDALAEELRQARLAAVDGQAVADLLASPATRGATVVPARVVGLESNGSTAPQRVTLDVGARDGIEVDRTVVSAGGLVGRVVAVAPWTCDVLLVGAPELIVGVRVGPQGVLGSVRAPGAALDGPRATGQLSLELLGQGRVAPGDRIVSLGSVDGRPYVEGVLVGTVASLDPPRGRQATSAAVTPAVDVGRLGVVGVVLTTARATPRPAATGSAS